MLAPCPSRKTCSPEPRSSSFLDAWLPPPPQVVPVSLCLCVSRSKSPSSLSCEDSSLWIKPPHFQSSTISTRLPLRRPHFRIRPHSQVLGHKYIFLVEESPFNLPQSSLIRGQKSSPHPSTKWSLALHCDLKQVYHSYPELCFPTTCGTSPAGQNCR